MENAKVYYIIKVAYYRKQHWWWPEWEGNIQVDWEDFGIEFESLELAERVAIAEDWEEYKIFRVELVEEKLS